MVEHFRENLDVYVPYKTETVIDSMQRGLSGLKRRFSRKSVTTQLSTSTNVARAASRMRHKSKASASGAGDVRAAKRHDKRDQSRLASTVSDSRRLGGSSRFDVMNPMSRTTSAILQTKASYGEDGLDHSNSEELGVQRFGIQRNSEFILSLIHI